MKLVSVNGETSEATTPQTPIVSVDTERKPASSTRRSALACSREPAVRVQVASAARIDVEVLRRHAWEIGSRHAQAKYLCPDSYVNLCAVSPGEALVVWRLQDAWIKSMAESHQHEWQGSRRVVRLYDVSFIEFNGFNAHQIRDVDLDGPAGSLLVRFPLSGTTQMAEVGFLLRTREFIPAARSGATLFPSLTVSKSHDIAALYVDDRLAPEPVASPWEGMSYLRERKKPRLRKGLRLALLSSAGAPGAEGDATGTFVSSLAGELTGRGMKVHVFAPASERFQEVTVASEVQYHPLHISASSNPVDTALAFARALEAELEHLPPFDHFHIQEWMTGLVPWLGTRAATVALSSIELTRRNGSEPTDLSKQIEKLESDIARAADCVIMPPWLRDKGVAALQLDGSRVHAFPMEGRPMDEWEIPLDLAKAKGGIGLGPTDRLLLFVGPLEWAGGPDLIVEALPTVLSRTANVRVAFVGCGGMHAAIADRAHHLGIGYAIRLLGHRELCDLIPLLRASEGLLLPSRQRVPRDHDVVALARRAGRPVITTHGGPGAMVRHEQDGLVIYDNPPSLVWGMSRLLDDRRHAEEMGRNGVQHGESGASWKGVARVYADLCAQSFAELREERGQA
jgi:glycosyltransferase involved in cell wall biosynthesis